MAKIGAYAALAAASILTTDQLPIQPAAVGAATRYTTVADIRTAVFTKTTNATGADTAAAATTIAANLSTGNATPGSIVFTVGAQVGGSSSTAQTAGTNLTLRHTTSKGQEVNIAGALTVGAVTPVAAGYITMAGGTGMIVSGGGDVEVNTEGVSRGLIKLTSNAGAGALTSFGAGTIYGLWQSGINVVPSAIGVSNFNIHRLEYSINAAAGVQSGTVTGFLINATETSLNSFTHNLFDLQVGSTSKFKVSNAGLLTTTSDILGGGDIRLPNGNNFYFASRAVLQSPANGQYVFANNAVTAGIGLDFATDGTLKVLTRALGDSAILSCATHSITGTNGTHFVTSTASGAGLLAGLRVQAGNGKALNLHGGTTAADIMQGVYYNQTSYLAAWSVAAVASGVSTLNLMPDGGAVDIGATTPSTLGYALIIRGNSANGIGIRLLNQASSGVKNWAYGPGLGGAGTSEVAWVPSTAADGSTFTTNVMKIDTVGRLTLTSGVTAGGVCAVNGATASSTTALITTASTTGVSSLRIPHGAAPTSPVDGDMWSTTTTLNFRLNGVTKSVTLI